MPPNDDHALHALALVLELDEATKQTDMPRINAILNQMFELAAVVKKKHVISWTAVRGGAS